MQSRLTSFGPESNISSVLPRSLVKFITKCTEYIGKLSIFEQYCIWRYTIGSASVNSFLIFGKPSDNSKYWCYLFFLYFHNTFPDVPKSMIYGRFKEFYRYFQNPELFQKNGTNEEISLILFLYSTLMDMIVNDAPKRKRNIVVYKVAGKYPGLPDINVFKRTKVLQLPFNSTTIDPHFNFAPFVSEDASCCFFKITIPGDVPCLYIPKEFHAYPFENEIILPPNVSFDIYDSYDAKMNYIDASSVNIVRVQDIKNTIMGAVFEVDTYKPCKTGACNIKSKIFHVFEAKLDK